MDFCYINKYKIILFDKNNTLTGKWEYLSLFQPVHFEICTEHEAHTERVNHTNQWARILHAINHTLCNQTRHTWSCVCGGLDVDELLASFLSRLPDLSLHWIRLFWKFGFILCLRDRWLLSESAPTGDRLKHRSYNRSSKNQRMRYARKWMDELNVSLISVILFA